MTTAEHLQLLIAHDLGAAIERLRSLARDTHYQNDALLLLARHNQLQRERRNGTTDERDLRLEANRLVSAASDLLNLLKEEKPEALQAEVEAPAEEAPPSLSDQRKEKELAFLRQQYQQLEEEIDALRRSVLQELSPVTKVQLQRVLDAKEEELQALEAQLIDEA